MLLSFFAAAWLFAVASASGPLKPDGSSPPTSFIPDQPVPWWPPSSFVNSAGALLPNPGASPFAFQFNGRDYGANSISLDQSLNADLPRSMTIEAWIWLPSNRAADQDFFPIVSRFNGQRSLDSMQDFALGIDAGNHLRFFMGGRADGSDSPAAPQLGLELESPTAVAVDAWTHVAVSLLSSDSGNPFLGQLLVNGVSVGQANWRAGAVRVFQTRDPVRLGQYQDAVFEGLLDEVRFWGEARTAEQVAAHMHLPLRGDEDGLVALYRLDDAVGAEAHDSGPAGHTGHSLRPLWTLSGPGVLHWLTTGVQGFPVDVELRAVDLAGTRTDQFEYTLYCLPEHGALFVPDDPKMEPVKETDLGARVFTGTRDNVGAALHLVCAADYTGPDRFCYAARRPGETEWSDFATVLVDCVAPPASGCLSKFDRCGVCGGDGTSCTTGGCDGRGGQVDACGVCAGDNSSCQCARYKGYTLDELECNLFAHSVNVTIARVESAINGMIAVLDALDAGDLVDGLVQPDFLHQVSHLSGLNHCSRPFMAELELFSEYADAYLESAYLCEE